MHISDAHIQDVHVVFLQQIRHVNACVCLYFSRKNSEIGAKQQLKETIHVYIFPVVGANLHTNQVERSLKQ